MNSVLKMTFFLCSDIYPISVIFVILWWEIGAISSFLVYQSYFTLTIIKAQEKIAQNTNNLSNLVHSQAQAEYYLVGPAKYKSDSSIFY